MVVVQKIYYVIYKSYQVPIRSQGLIVLSMIFGPVFVLSTNIGPKIVVSTNLGPKIEQSIIFVHNRGPAITKIVLTYNLTCSGGVALCV